MRSLIEQILNELAIQPKKSNQKFSITNVFYNESKGKVVIAWSDGTTTSATCAAEDTFDLRVGFSIAFTNKLCGGRSGVNKLINEHARNTEKKVKVNDNEEK